MGGDSKKFLKAIVTGYAFMVTNMLVSLWLVPFTLKYLSRPEYAIYAIATDLLSWLGLANLGVVSVFNSRGAQLMGRGDHEELNIVASTTFFTQMASAIIVLLAGFVVTMKPELLFSKDASADHLQAVVAILVTSFTISYILQPLNSMLVASKQIHVDNYLKFGLLVINTALTVLFLTRGLKLLSIALSNFAGTVIISIITWIRVKKTLGYVKIHPALWRFDRFKFLLKNGIWFSIGGLAGIFILRMDSFLIGQYISLSTVTSYVITIKLYQIADKIHQQFFNTTRPYFSQVYGKGDMKLLSRMHNLSFNLSFTLAFVMGIAVMMINKWFITKWVGTDFYLGNTINLLLCINFILQAAVLPNRIVLVSTLYKNELHSITRISEGLCKILLAISFLKRFGIPALITFSIFSSIVFSNIWLNILTAKLFKEPVFKKILPLVILFIIPLINSINDVFIKYSICIISLFFILFISLKQALQYKDLIKPFYVQLFNKNSAKV